MSYLLRSFSKKGTLKSHKYLLKNIDEVHERKELLECDHLALKSKYILLKTLVQVDLRKVYMVHKGQFIYYVKIKG